MEAAQPSLLLEHLLTRLASVFTTQGIILTISANDVFSEAERTKKIK